MPIRIATWNINSVRLRLPLVSRFIEEYRPDILCLQEIKCLNDQFPEKKLRELGYAHQAVHGQKGYHGVAIISRLPFSEMTSRDFCAMGDSRHLCVTFPGSGRPFRLHNIYLPAGGDIPDPAVNPKFGHKLRFVEELRGISAIEDGVPAILVGDLNIAPLENDVWSHRQLLKIVSHTPVETQGLTAAYEEGGWQDLIRQAIPPDQRVYTWWSYRARDWRASDRGRRLDHMWSAPQIATRLTRLDVLKDVRGWDRPSDHVPVIAELDLA